MASTSGPRKDQEEEPVHGPGQRKPHESTSSAAATSTDDSIAATSTDDSIVAAAEGSPEKPGGGGRGTDGSGSAAAAGEQRGKGKVVEEAVDKVKKERKKSDSPLKKFIRRSILAGIEGFKKKLSDRQGKQLDGASTSNLPPHVDHKKIPMEEAVYHYFGDIHNVLSLWKRERESATILRLVPLHGHYSALRPVYRDGESFYRSFIFSYLEQIVDRVDTCEEDRLLAAVRELARRAEHFQWASEFSRRRKAFEILIEKIKGWKSISQYPTSRVGFLKRYNRDEFLLEFFSSYDTTDDIFDFLRLAAAIWMCSPDNRAMYAPGVIGLGEGRSLEDWCSTQVIPPRVHADEVAVRALAGALQVFVRVETPDYGGRQDSYYIARDRPRVTLLRIDSQYDIIYPLSPDLIHQRDKRGGDLNLQRLGQRLGQQQQRQGGGGGGGGGGQQHPNPSAGTSRGGPGHGEGDRAESSSQGAARARWFHSCAGGSKKKQS